MNVFCPPGGGGGRRAGREGKGVVLSIRPRRIGWGKEGQQADGECDHYKTSMPVLLCVCNCGGTVAREEMRGLHKEDE